LRPGRFCAAPLLLPHGEGFPKLLSLKLEYPDLLDVDAALLFEL
jgi:hypothetical protein